MKTDCAETSIPTGTTGTNGGSKGLLVIGRPATNLTPIAFPMLWLQAVMQVCKEAKSRGNDRRTIAVTESTCIGFLRDNGQVLNAKVDPTFLARLEQALNHGGLSTDPAIIITSSAVDLTALETRARALVRACHALMEEDFAAVLRACLQCSGLKYQEVAAQLGVKVTKIKTWLANNTAFVMDMTPAQAVQLDRILGADGKLVATYAAMTQDLAYAPIRTAMDQVLGRKTFAEKLWECRQAITITKRALLAAVAVLSGISVSESLLAKWEQGYSLPCREMRGVIAVLDDIYEAGGALLDAWEAEDPQPTYSPYAFAFARWLKPTQAQCLRMFRYKTANPEKLPRSKSRSGDRWRGNASQKKLQAWCEHFFGFLVNVRHYPPASLSLTLLADWPLVEDYFEFVRRRTGREGYTQDAFTTTSQLHNLQLFFLPALAAEAVQEAHWNGRLPTIATGLKEIVPGVFREETIALRSPEEGWCHHLALAARAARAFQRNNQFSNGSLLGRAELLVEAEVGVARIAAEVGALLWEAPVRIRCCKLAILSRRWAAVALSVACSFRPANFLNLRLDQVELLPNLKIKLKITEDQIKTKGLGASQGGVQGLLPDWDWVHYALWYYITQGRPFLVREAAARGEADAGYFFTPAAMDSASAGRSMSAKSLQADAMLILGYKLYAQRYLFAIDACGRNVPLEDAAIRLLHSPYIHRKHYERMTRRQKNRRANRHMEAMLLGKC